MLEKKFLEGIIGESITVEPCKESDKIKVTLDKKFITENIYQKLQCRTIPGERVIKIVTHENKLIGKIYYDVNSFLNKREAQAYADMVVRKLNKDMKEVLLME